MTKRLQLSGRSEAKGRNGYFKLDRIELGERAFDHTHARYSLEFLSRRAKTIGAARVDLTRDEFIAFVKFLNEIRETI